MTQPNTIKKWLIEDQGGAHRNPSVAIRPLFTNLNVTCKIQVISVGFTRRHLHQRVHARTQKIDFIDRQTFSRQALFGPKGSYEEFKSFEEVYEQI